LVIEQIQSVANDVLAIHIVKAMCLARRKGNIRLASRDVAYTDVEIPATSSSIFYAREVSKRRRWRDKRSERCDNSKSFPAAHHFLLACLDKNTTACTPVKAWFGDICHLCLIPSF
jgi:hypothetical protein